MTSFHLTTEVQHNSKSSVRRLFQAREAVTEKALSPIL